MANQPPTIAQLADTIVALQAQITTLQGQQQGITAHQLQQVLQAVNTPTHTAFNPGVNQVLTARARQLDIHAPDVPNEDHAPIPGAPNIKSTKPPSPFSGHKSDARPFLDRVDAWFTLVPDTYRLTRSRILATCGLITSRPADSWAISVLNAVTRNEDTPYYYDNWEDFKGEFLRNFGIANESEEALNAIMRIQQGNLELSVFTAEFLRLKVLSRISDEAAVREYRRGLERKLFYQVSYLNPQPTTLEEWIIAARQRDLTIRDARTFDAINRSGRGSVQNHPPPRTMNATFPQQSNPPYRPPHHPQRDPNAMDVDRVDTRDARVRDVRFQTPTASRMGTAPPTILKRPVATSSRPERPINCFRCGRPGHMARECKVAINNISEQHLQVLMNTLSHTEMAGPLFNKILPCGMCSD